MSNKELIKKIDDAFMELAKLQKSGLEDTQAFPNYNVVSAQIIKLDFFINQNKTAEAIQPILKNLHTTYFPQFEKELDEMIAAENTAKAKELYATIKTDIKALYTAFEQPMQSEEVKSQSSSSP